MFIVFVNKTIGCSAFPA